VKHINCEIITTVVTFLSHLLSFTNDKTNFVMQFIELGGLALYTTFHLLSPENNEPSALIESCNLLSQIARFSKDTYPHISSINPYNDLKTLLKSNDNELKSRALYLIGNMCRHSNFFYDILSKHDLIK
jgi:fused-like protein